MPSSTSSSSAGRIDALRTGGERRTWAAVAILTTVFLGLFETTVRMHGFRPSVPNDVDTWILARARVRPDSVVLIGTSRSLCDVDPAALSAALERHTVQLSIPGGSILPMLEHFAADEDFRGTLIADYIPRIVFDITGDREPRVVRNLDQWRTQSFSPSATAESHLRVLVTSNLAFRDPAFALLRTLAIPNTGFPQPEGSYFTADRFQHLDFELLDAQERARWRASGAMRHGEEASPEERDRIIARCDRAVERIEARGGAVLFVRFPVSGLIAEAEELRYPRADFWDVHAARGRGRFLHCADVDALDSFELPDGSHLDWRDAADFSRALAANLPR